DDEDGNGGGDYDDACDDESPILHLSGKLKNMNGAFVVRFVMVARSCPNGVISVIPPRSVIFFNLNLLSLNTVHPRSVATNPVSVRARKFSYNHLRCVDLLFIEAL
ncbi:hypothetical protein Tco_1307495, partial [Tanacetum coccineum]